jgi:hypothetical protein
MRKKKLHFYLRKYEKKKSLSYSLSRKPAGSTFADNLCNLRFSISSLWANVPGCSGSESIISQCENSRLQKALPLVAARRAASKPILSRAGRCAVKMEMGRDGLGVSLTILPRREAKNKLIRKI